jgi:hypothetical protein
MGPRTNGPPSTFFLEISWLIATNAALGLHISVLMDGGNVSGVAFHRERPACPVVA